MMKQDDEKELMDMLRMTAPGTGLRDGLDNVLRANTGGLIVIGDEDTILPLARGGFSINADYSPAHLYELAKMDGAILLNADCSRIICANMHLNPDPSTPSSETGIRHRSAEQTARQTGELVISISQRRRLITLYKGTRKYILREPGKLLGTANQAVVTLDKYKSVFVEALMRLSTGEFDDVVNLLDVLQVIQRAEMLKRVESELAIYIVELGNESRLIRMQLDELIANVDEEERLTLCDYFIYSSDENKQEQIDRAITKLRKLSNEDLLDTDRLAAIFGYELSHENNKRRILHPRGYRLVHKIPRLPSPIVENVVEHFGSWEKILKATPDELDEVDGVGPVRAQQIITGLDRLRLQTSTDGYWS